MLGPTASSKSEVAINLAEMLEGVILSVDSMQVYRGMDIGTAKPSQQDRQRVEHLMIDLVDPDYDYTVAEFQRTARELLGGNRPVIIAGGSGLHFRAIVDPLEFPPTDPALRAELETWPQSRVVSELLEADPGAGEHIDLKNPRRVVRAFEVLRLTGETPTDRVATPQAVAVSRYEPLIPFRAYGIDPGEKLQARIVSRLRTMRDQGLLSEVASLAPVLGRTASQAVGYSQLLEVVDGTIGAAEGFLNAERATYGLARAQRTFFRRDPRITWLPWDDDPMAISRRISDDLEN